MKTLKDFSPNSFGLSCILYSKFKQHKSMQVNHSKLCQKNNSNKKDLIPLLSTKKCLTNMKVHHIPLYVCIVDLFPRIARVKH